MAQVLDNLGRALLKVNVASRVSLHPAADNLLFVSRCPVHKRRQTAYVVSQRFRGRNLVQALVLFVDVTGKHHVHLPKLWPCGNSLHIIVYEITVFGCNHGIQLQTLMNDGNADILFEHLVSSSPPTGIAALGYRVGVVFDGFTPGNAEFRSKAACNLGIQDGIEMLIGHFGGIDLKGIHVWYIALYEQLQQAHIDKTGTISDNAGQKLLILLVTAQLRLAIFGPGNYNLVQF